MRVTSVLVSLAVASLGTHAKELTATSFELSYESMIEIGEVPALSECASVGSVAFKDVRAAHAAGERSLEKQPTVKQAIAATGDVPEWLRASLESVARTAVLQLQVVDRPSLSVNLSQLWLEEVVYRRAEYDGRVVLDVTVKSADGKQTCFEGRVKGDAENYGYAGKLENYQETANHALDRALVSLLSSSSFTDALCSCRRAGSDPEAERH